MIFNREKREDYEDKPMNDTESEKSEKSYGRNYRNIRIGYIYIPLWFCMAVELFFAIANWEEYALPAYNSLILGSIFIYLLYILFVTISKSTFVGTIITSIVLFTLLVVDKVKIVYSTEPLYLKDFRFLNSTSTLGGILDGTLLPILNTMKKSMCLFGVKTKF